ncbi:MAG: hypothetical protein ACRDBP_01460 [Luteolibacter sp.]
MHSLLITSILFAALVAAVLLGRRVRKHLPEDHLSADSKDAVKLAMGLIATMTALLLGLLVSSAKGTYDTQRTQIIVMASKVAFMDRVLHAYGPEAAGARAAMVAAVADAIHRMWPDEPGARGELTANAAAGDGAYATLQALAPRDDLQRGLKEQAITMAVEIGQIRMLMLAQAVPSIPKLLLITVGCWLAIIFLCFGLLAPPNATTTLALSAAALSVAGAVFLMMELDQPLGGMIQISSEPLTQAIQQLAK